MEDTSVLDDTLLQLQGFTHIAFTSRNGIQAVLQRLEMLHDGAEAARAAVKASGVKLCALGRDALALTEAGYSCAVTPQESSTQGLVMELTARGEAEGARVLCPVPRVENLSEPPIVPRFLAALAAAGAVPTRLDAYVTTFGCGAGEGRVECGLLANGSIDAVVFSSTAESEALAKAMGGVETLRAAVNDHKVLLAAHGPYTAAGATAVLGLEVNCVSQRFGSFVGVLEALEGAFERV